MNTNHQPSGNLHRGVRSSNYIALAAAARMLRWQHAKDHRCGLHHIVLPKSKLTILSSPSRQRLPAWWLALRESSFAITLALFVLIITSCVALQFIEPAPPRQLVIATGTSDGAYQQFGQQLSVELAAHDVTLSVLETNGSIDNLRHLKNRTADIAFAQSGLADPADYPNFEAFGAVYFEPVWVFSRAERPFMRLVELKGKKVAAGGAGSGSYRVARHLLAENSLTTQDVTLTNHAGLNAVDALHTGEVDAIISVSSISAPMIQSALNDSELSLVNVSRAAAYARRQPLSLIHI